MDGGSLDILADELSLFQIFGNSSPTSKFPTVVTMPGTVYGSPHAVPGDVDNSGCTDQADLTELLQKDVWLQQAGVLPARRSPS